MLLLFFRPTTLVAAESATGTGAANNAAVAVTASGGNATGTGTANDAAPAVTVSAENAAGAGTANNAAPVITPAAGNASGTGAANQPACAVSCTSEAATGTGTANSAAPAVTPAAGNAAGTGAANNAATAVTVSGGNASGAGEANQPAAAVTVLAGAATGTGVALDGDPTVEAVANAPAAPAMGSGDALDAVVATARTALAEAASGTGAANNAAIFVSSHVAGGWWALVRMLAELRRLAGESDPEACWPDGEPYRDDHNGLRVCPFDGHRPDGKGPAKAGQDWGGLRKVLDEAVQAARKPEPGPTPDEIRAGWADGDSPGRAAEPGWGGLRRERRLVPAGDYPDPYERHWS